MTQEDIDRRVKEAMERAQRMEAALREQNGDGKPEFHHDTSDSDLADLDQAATLRQLGRKGNDRPPCRLCQVDSLHFLQVVERRTSAD